MGYCSSPFLSLLKVLPEGTNLSFLNFDSLSFFAPPAVIVFQGLTNTQSGVLANFMITSGGNTFNITIPVNNILALGV